MDKYYCNECKRNHKINSKIGKSHKKSANTGKKKISKSVKEAKLIEQKLIIMALKQLERAEKERKLNPAQRRRRQELKSKLNIINKELEKYKKSKPEPLNIKDKRPLKEFHYLVLKGLRETPNVTERNIYIEDEYVKTFPKSYLKDLVVWNYAVKSKKNRYSITRQGRWKLKQLERKVKEDKRKAKLKEYQNIVKKLVKTKKELPVFKKKLEDFRKENQKIKESISELTKKEWEKHRFDYKQDIYDRKKQSYVKFEWSNPKEAELIISMETGGRRYKKFRKVYSDYYDRRDNVKRLEKLIDKDIIEIITKGNKEIRKEIILLEEKLKNKHKEPAWTSKLYEQKLNDINKLDEKIRTLKEWIK